MRERESVCVCVCVCARERKRERERESVCGRMCVDHRVSCLDPFTLSVISPYIPLFLSVAPPMQTRCASPTVYY